MSWWSTKTQFDILVDNDSWILPHAQILLYELKKLGYRCNLARSHQQLNGGDVLFLLGCTQITPQSTIDQYHRALVVHESDLPNGKGFAPMTWQILEGKNLIPFSLIEAVENVDSGAIYLQRNVQLCGTELCDEIRALQGETTISLCLEYAQSPTEPEGKAQQGDESFYPRRTPKDSELDINKTLAQQFEQLRVADNKAYPAFFHYRGETYQLAITKVDNEKVGDNQ